MSTLGEIGTYLEAVGVASGSATPPTLYLGSRPDSPDECLTVYEYPGDAPSYIQEQTAPSDESVQIQVVARSVDYEAASELISKAWTALALVINMNLSGTKYHSIRPNHSPSTMGRDTNDRILLFFNATVSKEVVLAALS
jgi:hypothetical protein